ncbi:MAG TPA: hypothetical protein VM580_15150 [Labilithrix sp.]|nr:hypothetical protein [Labilithrix sp.]
MSSDSDSGATETTAPPEPTSPPDPTPPEPVHPEGPPTGIGPIGGRLFTHVRAPTSDPLDQSLQQVSASAWLEARPRFNQTTSARLTLTADALAVAIDGTSGFRANLREAYVDASKNGWQLRVGQQIVPWGNADGINPTDVLGARDLAFFAADTEVRRIGSTSLLGSFTPNGGDSPLTITLIATPIFPSYKVIFPPNAIPAGVVLEGISRPKPRLDSVEVAARVALVGSGWDIALMAFQGYNHMAELEFGSQAATGIAIRQVHRRNFVGGLQASASAGNWIFRIEGAYLHNYEVSDDHPATQPSNAQAVLGIERPLGERFRLQIQGVGKYSPLYTAPDRVAAIDPALVPVQRAIAQVNAVLFNHTDQIRAGGTARLAFTTENEFFEAEVFGLFYATGLDGLVRPMVTLRASDALRFSLGAEILFGPSDAALGALRRYSGGFFEARYSF